VADSAPKSKKFAGDSSTWTSSYTDYPASSAWVATCVFQKPGQEPLSLEGTASGTDFVFTFTAEQSAALAPGRWTWAIRVAKDTTATTVEIGETIIRPNPQAVAAPSHAEKCLKLIEAALEERFVDVQESISILGQDISKVPAGELERLLNRYQAKVNNERRHAHRLATGSRRTRGRIFLAG
jgi:hypothetical protein